MLDSYLGLKWDERILNLAGDFAYVIPGTIKYWLGQRSPIIEYKLIGEQYARTEVENSNFITTKTKLTLVNIEAGIWESICHLPSQDVHSKLELDNFCMKMCMS